MSYRKHVVLTLGQHWATVVWLWCDGLFIQLGHVTYIITFYPFVCQSIRIIYLLVIYLLLIYFFMRASLPVPFPIPSVFCSVLWSSFVCLVFCYCLCLSYDISSYYILRYSSIVLLRFPPSCLVLKWYLRCLICLRCYFFVCDFDVSPPLIIYFF